MDFSSGDVEEGGCCGGVGTREAWLSQHRIQASCRWMNFLLQADAHSDSRSFWSFCVETARISRGSKSSANSADEVTSQKKGRAVVRAEELHISCSMDLLGR